MSETHYKGKVAKAEWDRNQRFKFIECADNKKFTAWPPNADKLFVGAMFECDLYTTEKDGKTYQNIGKDQDTGESSLVVDMSSKREPGAVSSPPQSDGRMTDRDRADGQREGMIVNNLFLSLNNPEFDWSLTLGITKVQAEYLCGKVVRQVFPDIPVAGNAGAADGPAISKAEDAIFE